MNPVKTVMSDHEEAKLFSKNFSDRRQFLRRDLYTIGSTLVVGWVGYTNLKDKEHQKEYRENSKKFIRETLLKLKTLEKKSQQKLGVLYGTSSSGIDMYVEEECIALDVPLVGITCPEFAKWCEDDYGLPPVIMTRNKDEYAELFNQKINTLFVTGGRLHTLQKDFMLSTMYMNDIYIKDCAPSVPVINPQGGIENAAKALIKLENTFKDEEAQKFFNL